MLGGGIRPVERPGASWRPNRALLTLIGQVAGLGNYGLRGTRHNVGMAVLDWLARQLAVAEGWRVDRQCCADVAVAAARGLELVLVKPRRFMNLNGLSVASAGEWLSHPKACCATGPRDSPAVPLPSTHPCSPTLQGQSLVSLSPPLISWVVCLFPKLKSTTSAQKTSTWFTMTWTRP